MAHDNSPITFKIDLPIYQPPPWWKVVWLRYRLQGRRFVLLLSKKGVLPCYLGEDPKLYFFLRRIRPGFRSQRYTCHLPRLVRRLGTEEGVRAWQSLNDPRPVTRQNTDGGQSG